MWHREDGGEDPGENGAETERSGALPDPESRHWRHPSELHRNHALPNPDPTPVPLAGHLRSPSSVRWPLMAVGGCLAVAAVGVLSLRTTLVSPTSLQTAAGTTTLPEWAIGLPGGTTARTESTMIADRPRSTALDPTPLLDTSTTITLPPQELWDLAAHHPAPLPSTTGPVRTPAPVQIDTAEVSEARVYGVYAEVDVEDSLLASVAVIGDEPVTSAAALGDRTWVWIRSGPVWTQAVVAAVDPLTDLALLEPVAGTAPLELPALPISAEPVLAGQPVMIGYGDLETADADRWGTVYAIGPTAATPTNHLVNDPIRAAIDPAPGDAGAPLRDDRGAVVGLTVTSNAPQVVAVPIEQVVEAIESLRRIGAGDDTWIGLDVRGGEDCLVIESVSEEGPATVLRPGDRIVMVGGEAMTHPDELRHAAREAGVGGSLVVTIERHGRRGAIDIEVGARPLGT